MGYLSCGTGNSALLGNRGGAWGWRGWGEGKVKAFFRQAGLGGGSGLRADRKSEEKGALAGPSEGSGRRHRSQPSPGSSEERADAEINVTSVFSVGDTSRLAELLEERDIILDNLEVAEARYISSFQPITPSPSPSLRSTVPLPAVPPSVTDGQNTSDSNTGIFSKLTNTMKSRPMSISSSSDDPNRDLKSRISRPRPLRGTYSRNTRGYTPMISGPVYPPNLSQNIQTTKARGRHRSNSAATGEHSDKTPTTYLAPSQYYKLRGVQGAGGGNLGSEQELSRVTKGEDSRRAPGFGEAIRSKLTGTRFLEVNRDSSLHGKIPLGSKVAVDEQGVLSPIELSKGPNHGVPEDETHGEEPTTSNYDQRGHGGHTPEEERTSLEDNELVMVDDAADVPHDQHANPARARPRPPKQGRAPVPPSVRETFPMRDPKRAGSGAEEPPPHLRLQSHQPYHRPISGLDHDSLGAIYANIRHWRAALKAINRDIAEAQEQGFQDLAEGNNIKGWILVGKGLRFLPGIQLIEGKSKEDIRWDELQRGDGMWSNIAFWVAVCVIGMLLGIGLLAAAGLALATSPDVVHYLPFLSPVVAHNNIPSGLATALAPAVAASLFIGLA
ncbi:hypothetical protein FRC16_007065, partial [Serendipita sp. 398]